MKVKDWATYFENEFSVLLGRVVRDGRIRVFAHQIVHGSDDEQEFVLRDLSVPIEVVEAEDPSELFVHGSARQNGEAHEEVLLRGKRNELVKGSVAIANGQTPDLLPRS